MPGRSYRVPKGAYIGALWKDFYTGRDGAKKIKLSGYIILGIFGNEVAGKEISAYKVEDESKKPSWLDTRKDFYVVRAGRRNVGWLVREVENNGKRRREHFWGTLTFGGVDVRIRVLPDKELEAAENDRRPDYRIELARNIKCGVVEI